MKIGNKEFKLGERTYIMGILNMTPDSFSDGGKYNSSENAMKRVQKMIEDGADIIDVGGESTRPGFDAVPAEEEIRRVVNIIKEIKKKFDITVSIDTYKAETARAALEAGADIVNDVWGFKKNKNIAKVTAEYNAACILTHNREKGSYKNLMHDVIMDLTESIDIALESGVNRENIILDPGICFAKTYEENLIVMNNLEKLKDMELPILLGTSRKSMIGLALDTDVNNRLEGTLATTVMGIMKGCEFVRVHDVLENKRAAMMTDKIIRAGR